MARCMFCGCKATKEHVWGRWTQKYFPASDEEKLKRGNHKVTKQDALGNKLVADGIWANAGDILSNTTKVLCRDCNNTWGSKIEQEMEAVFRHVFVDHQRTLDARQADALVRWLFLKNCLHERACPLVDLEFGEFRPKNYLAVKEAETNERARKWLLFKETLIPPDDYKFFLGFSPNRNRIAHNFIPMQGYNVDVSKEILVEWQSLTLNVIHLCPMMALVTNEPRVIQKVVERFSGHSERPLTEIRMGKSVSLSNISWDDAQFEDTILGILDNPDAGFYLRRNF